MSYYIKGYLQEVMFQKNKNRRNIECEIMQVVLDEVPESYDENIVFEMTSHKYNGENLECNLRV